MVLEIIIVLLAAALAVVAYLYKKAAEESRRLAALTESLSFDKKSLSVKYGKMTEQFIPFLESYPYSKENFRFLGSPVDGVQFEPDKVIFIEFKVGDSRLSKLQEQVRGLVEAKKVEFREVRIK
jgi:predicted Holliday junction resolvase-like endonuclease